MKICSRAGGATGSAGAAVWLVEFDDARVVDGEFDIPVGAQNHAVTVPGGFDPEHSFVVFWSKSSSSATTRDAFAARVVVGSLGALNFLRGGADTGRGNITGRWWLVESEEFIDVQHISASSAMPGWTEGAASFQLDRTFLLYSYSGDWSDQVAEPLDCNLSGSNVSCNRADVGSANVDVELQLVSFKKKSRVRGVPLTLAANQNLAPFDLEASPGPKMMPSAGALSEAGVARIELDVGSSASAHTQLDFSGTNLQVRRATIGSAIAQHVDLIDWID